MRDSDRMSWRAVPLGEWRGGGIGSDGRRRPETLLTGREREVLQPVAEEKTTKEIAAHLSINVKTADAHPTRLMQKLDPHDIASLTCFAIRQGVIQP